MARLGRTMVTVGAALSLAPVYVLASALPAAASTSSGATIVQVQGSALVVVAAPGKQNDILVGQDSRGLVVVDQGNTVAASHGCTNVDVQTAVCPTAGVKGVFVDAGDLNDNVFATYSDLLPAALIGGDGNDVLLGGPASSVLIGGAGDDVLRDDLPGQARTGNDYLDGGPGNDMLRSNLGNDTLNGGPGDDQLLAVDGVSGNDKLNGGPNLDICSADVGDAKTGCEA